MLAHGAFQEWSGAEPYCFSTSQSLKPGGGAKPWPWVSRPTGRIASRLGVHTFHTPNHASNKISLFVSAKHLVNTRGKMSRRMRYFAHPRFLKLETPCSGASLRGASSVVFYTRGPESSAISPFLHNKREEEKACQKWQYSTQASDTIAVQTFELRLG